MFEVVECGEMWVEEVFGDVLFNGGVEVGDVQGFEFIGGFVVVEYVFIDGFQQQVGCDGVELWVVFYVLQGDLDDCFVELLCCDVVKQGEFEFVCDLGDLGDVFVEILVCVFDCDVDFVGVVCFVFIVVFYDCDGYLIYFFCVCLYLFCYL